MCILLFNYIIINGHIVGNIAYKLFKIYICNFVKRLLIVSIKLRRYMKKRLELKNSLLLTIFMLSLFGMIFTTGCKTCETKKMSMPVPYDIEGNTPK